MLLPGLFAPNTPESTDGKRLSPFADSASDAGTTGFGQMFTEFKADLMPASAPVSMARIAMPFDRGETGQDLPLERQFQGFQGFRTEQTSLSELQQSLDNLGETIDQILLLDAGQRAELADYLDSELGLTGVQQEEVFDLLWQWQQTPPSVSLSDDQLNEAGPSGQQAISELGNALDVLNQELSVWLHQANGQQSVAGVADARLDSILDNPYLAQWFLGESRPEKGEFSAADWLAQSMQHLMKAASSGSIPMTLDPMRPEALLLKTVDTEPPAKRTQVLNLDLLMQSRQTRVSDRMDAPSLTLSDSIPLTPERGLVSPLIEEKGLLTSTLERMQRPMPMAQSGQALTERLLIMIQNEVSQATIRLDPPELGMMDIRIQVQNDQTQIQILVQTPQVREALESQSTRLREFLEQQGLGLADFDVTDQQQQNERQNSEQTDNERAALEEADSGADKGESLTKQVLGLVDQFV